jgi:hypothetical protein
MLRFEQTTNVAETLLFHVFGFLGSQMPSLSFVALAFCSQPSIILAVLP